MELDLVTGHQDRWVLEVRDGVTVAAHVQPVGGRLVVTEVLVRADEVTTDVLRRVYPARMAASKAKSIRNKTVTAEGERLTAKVIGAEDLTIGQLLAEAERITAGPPRQRLGRPDGSDPDGFYRKVAAAYGSAAAESSHAAKLLAEENAVPVETIRRWVKEARRRGHLEAGRRGSAG